MKPSTESLIFAIELVVDAWCGNRSDLTDEIMTDIMKLRSKIQYLQEIDCEQPTDSAMIALTNNELAEKW